MKTSRRGEEINKLNMLLEPLAGTRTIAKKGIRVENTNYFNPILGAYLGETWGNKELFTGSAPSARRM